MSETMKKPRIRFKGFTEAWEQRKVREVTDRYDNLRIPVAASLRVAGTTPYYGANGIQDYVEGYTHDGEFILVAEDGANDLKNYPVKCIKGRIWVNNHAHVLQGKCACADNQFLAYAISQADIESLLVGGGRAKLNAETLMDIELLLPSKDEQIQIGHYLARLDHLITLHQRKYDKLLNIKKSMLEKMFPKNGNDVPEIRFKGFTDAWEQRKLGDLYTERNEQGDNSLQILSVSIHVGVSDGELTADRLGKKVHRSEDKSTYKHVYAGDLIFNMMRAWQGAIGVAKNEGMTSPAYISAIPNYEVYPPFMNYLLRRKDAIDQINNLSYGVTDFRKRLYWNSFIRVTCQIPCVAEQKRIAEVFETIDNLITLHQRKLEKLKNIKKSMLEKMFV